ncbi:MAG: ATPase, T2SS/T4P/T4SS family, partial [Mariprofundus sp.]|nr:ATPase, T2SS/T4P/T4SS family [Mariprofundus sp.]
MNAPRHKSAISPDGISHRYQNVSINLMSGETIEGYLLGFSSIMNKLHFFEKNRTDDNTVSRNLDIEDIVYVGLHHPPGAPKQHKGKLEHMDELKIITVNQDSFAILASPAMSNTPGFYAIGKDDSLPYEHIFFYHHGIRYQEKPERLGDLLIDQEVIDKEDIQQALDIQAQNIPHLGDILKEQGKVSDSDIKQALDIQQRQRMKMGDLLVDQELVSAEDIHDALQKQSQSEGLPIGHILKKQGKIQDSDIDTALEMQQRRKMRLGEILIEANLITEDDIQFALAEQKVRGQRIGEILLNSQLISEDQLLNALARKFRLPTVDLDEYEINPISAKEIGQDVIEKYGILPIDSDKHSVTIALSDPMGLEAYEGICFKTGKKVHEVMSKASQLKQHIETFLQEDHADEELSCEFLQHDTEDKDEPLNEFEITQSAEDAPIISLVNRIIRNGLKKKASDIHILPQSKKITLAYRLNGQLLAENALDYSLHKQIAARIKILCGMNIAEQRMPQDGRLLLRDGRQQYEFRVSCIPNSFGESMVLRVLNKDMAVELDVLGLRDEDVKKLSTLARKPYGLMLVTGPTGSGKSTTLFAILKSIAHLPTHILTIEDPVESEIPGANQIQVNHKIGMSFARILRNVLRHDPDIIMI